MDWDPSAYPLLEKIQSSVEKYMTLWHTALDFHEKHERWYFGPLLGLDTTEIQVDNTYETTV